MDIYKAILQLREEKRRLDRAIARLEQNGGTNGDRRRRSWNSGARRAAAERMRKYWELRKQKSVAATGSAGPPYSVNPPSTDSV